MFTSLKPSSLSKTLLGMPIDFGVSGGPFFCLEDRIYSQLHKLASRRESGCYDNIDSIERSKKLVRDGFQGPVARQTR